MRDKKKISSISMAFMVFMTVWGFGNVINGYYYFGGINVIVLWILVFALYFIPYALMVGELGSSFKEKGGGVSSWIDSTIGPKLAYFAGWTYMVVHIPYLSQKANNCTIGLGYIIYGDGRISKEGFTFSQTGILANIPVAMVVQLVSLAIFVLGVIFALRGINFMKKIVSVAGIATFVLSILFILLMVVAPFVTNKVSYSSLDFSFEKLFSSLGSVSGILNLSILIFAVGGCEKLSPYVNKMKNPSKGFSRGMIIAAILVAVCAIFGTIATGMLFSGEEIGKDFVANGKYLAFQKVGNYLGMGNVLMYIFAVTEVVATFSVLIVSIDAPLRVLLDSADERYIPKSLLKKNKHDVYNRAILLMSIFVVILIVIPALGIGAVSGIAKSIVDLNSICMPLRYLWVFVAYFFMKKSIEKFNPEFKFVKSKVVGLIFAVLCFTITLAASCMKMFNASGFELILNIATPFILVGLGFILPWIAKKKNKV